MGSKVPILQGVRLSTRVVELTSRNSKYRYPYIHIPATIKALVEGRFFEAKIVDERTIHYVMVDQPTPTSYKPMKRGRGAIYIRLPIHTTAKDAIIELTENGFIVYLKP